MSASTLQQKAQIEGKRRFSQRDKSKTNARAKIKSLDDWVKEAAMCGLSYGQYRAAIAQGKSFEKLRLM